MGLFKNHLKIPDHIKKSKFLFFVSDPQEHKGLTMITE